MTQAFRKKLIEVALPLEAINRASAREKSIRHGHPSTLHLWWARRPLSAARAVIFAQMVDDPSSCADLFPTQEAQEAERQRLFRIIEELVEWENTNNEKVLQQARDEIWKSWRRTCKQNENHPMARELFDPERLPPFHDPFAGGGALPLEAQRLGLAAHASDLNPVAVLINKAMIEIPPRFAGVAPVNRDSREKLDYSRAWSGGQGLAEDIRYYGAWIQHEAQRRIGKLYPPVEITKTMAEDRPDLRPLVGKKLTCIAWLWARTVHSPDPAFSAVEVPLAASFILSAKEHKEVYIEPVVEGRGYRFVVRMGKPPTSATWSGTKLARASFRCLVSGAPISADYIKSEAKAGRLGTRLMAVVAEGDRGRVYLSPTKDMQATAHRAVPEWRPDVEFFQHALGFRVGNYGMTKWSDLFTPRQLVALSTLSDLVGEAHREALRDARQAGLPDDGKPFAEGGHGSLAYADAVSVYLAFALSKQADLGNSLCRWEPVAQCPRQLFGRQAIPMIWDYAEGNPLGESSGAWLVFVEGIAKAFAKTFEHIPDDAWGAAQQLDAGQQEMSMRKVVSTDPPYYDNIGYADLSDFFYVWLRRSLKPMFPGLFSTLAVPKCEELVATPERHGGREQAEAFFLNGMTEAMHRLAQQAHPAFPITIYYAFKQSEHDVGEGTASTGWETFLDATIRAGFSTTGTWPMRTENDSRLRGQSSNALASSVVLVCRSRPQDAAVTTRAEFLRALKVELPEALAALRRGNIAPVDLAQAAIGPGMAVYTRYAKVVDTSGQRVTVRDALAAINRVLDEALAEQEGDFDAETRWALAWFEQFGFDEGEFGVAETFSKAKNTSVGGLVEAGFLRSKGGRVRLLRPEELSPTWDPEHERRPTAWEAVHYLVRALALGGEQTAAELALRLGGRAESARELAYRLFALCERKKRAPEALAYNGLVQSWPEIMRLAREKQPEPSKAKQATLFGEG